MVNTASVSGSTLTIELEQLTGKFFDKNDVTNSRDGAESYYYTNSFGDYTNDVASVLMVVVLLQLSQVVF